MKKALCVLLVVALCLSCLGCGKTDSKVVKIAIVQQLDHASLDEIRNACESRLQALAAEQGLTLEIKTFNGQNDSAVLNQIGAQVASGGYRLIIPIATLAAQCMVTATDGLPIVYAAVSDPEAAGLTGLPQVTGTSDALNVKTILDMMLAVQPELKTVGLLYSLSEVNSQAPIAQLKQELEALGLQWVEKTGNTADEILTAVGTLVGQVDAVFTPTDNSIMAVEPAVAELLLEAGIPHYTGADSFVAEGAFATCGVNYTELGAYTADMAMDILLGGSVPEFHIMEGGIFTVNTATAAALELDCAPLEAMASQLVKVGE